MVVISFFQTIRTSAVRQAICLGVLHALTFELAYLSAINSSSWRLIASLAISAIVVSLLFYWLLQFPRAKRITLPLILFYETVCIYFSWRYGVLIDTNSVAFLLETDLSESREFIDMSVLYASITCTIMVVAAVLLTPRLGSPRKYRSRLGFLIFALAIVAAFSQKQSTARPDRIQYPLSFRLPISLAGYGSEYIKLRWAIAMRADLSTLPISNAGDDLEIVLVIGESARAANFGLNGYGRNTTPRLSELNVTSYDDVTSCAASTRISVPCIVTRASFKAPERASQESSFFPIFNILGFETWWFSNHRVMGKNDSLISSLAKEAQFTDFQGDQYITRRDENLLPRIENVLRKTHKRRLTVIHSIGSHWQYALRYGKEFERFKPVCTAQNPSDCTTESLVNAYDNSILYTDAFLAQIIRRLENRRAFLIYTPDHGESLGEDGHYLHGQPWRQEQRKVPMIFWASDAFEKDFPERVKNARSASAHKLSHDYVFHSLLDCAGIEGQAIDKSLSLCRP